MAESESESERLRVRVRVLSVRVRAIGCEREVERLHTQSESRIHMEV